MSKAKAKSKDKLNKLNKLTTGLLSVRVIFKEILQLTPPEFAERLADAIRDGTPIQLNIMQNSRGRHFKTAFAWQVGGVAEIREPDALTFESKGWIN